jgi:anti-sigma factor RsiW
MHNCDSLDPLVTPFVDGELADPDRRAVEDHLRVCPPCYTRVTSERAVHDLVRARRDGLCRTEAPDALHHRCAALAQRKATAENAETAKTFPTSAVRIPNPESRIPSSDSRIPTSRRVAPFALAASLVVVVGGAFVYQATDKSARVLAAELVADHAKCFAMNSALGTHQAAAVVEQSMAASFDWRMHLPADPSSAGLELVGARPCLYGEGKIAHIMYKHQGHPVSVFMLPNTERAQELVEVLGHEAAIWCANNRTFVVVAREPRREVEQIASFVQASLH